ncbi:hypothetical protein LTR40_014822, partial [Exophiala xenobiotica]
PKWVVELNSGLPSKPKHAQSIPDPPGFSSSRSAGGKQVSKNRDHKEDFDLRLLEIASLRKERTYA